MSDSPSASDGESILFADLLSWLEGGEKSQALLHLEGADPRRFARMQELCQRMNRGLSQASELRLSARQRDAALSLVRTRGSELAAGVRRLVARLVDGPQQAAPAVRSQATRASFHSLYDVEGYDVDVSLSEDGELLGQILPKEGDENIFLAGSVLWQAGDRSLHLAEIDEDGAFYVARPAVGRGRLVLSGEGVEVVISDLELLGP